MAEWADDWESAWGGAEGTIDTHVEDAQDRLPFFHKDKANIKAIIEVFAERWQRIDNITADMATIYDIERGSGFALDAVGENIGISRLGFDDTFYSVMLETQSTIVIPGRRTVEGLLTMVRSLLNDDTRPIIYSEFPIKSFLVEIVDLTADELEFFPRFLALTKPATYNAQFIASKTDGFVKDDSSATVVVTGEGYSDSSLTIDVGGEYAFVIPV